MTLDVPTLLVFSGFVVVTSSGMFLAEAWARLGRRVDRLWSIAFTSAIATAIAYLTTAVEPDLWWINAFGNGASVLTVWAMWCGVRAHAGRPPRFGLALLVTAAAAAAVIVDGPDAGAWAGGAVSLIGTATGALGASAAILRGPMRHHRAGLLLAIILALAGGFYALRSFIFVLLGPDSDVWTAYLSTAPATVITTVLVNAAAFVAVMLRTLEAGDGSPVVAASFDPVTGVRTAESFVDRARRTLDASRRTAQPVAFVVIAPEEIEAIAAAYGRPAAAQAHVTVGEMADEHRRAHDLVGNSPSDEHAVHALLRGCSRAEVLAWATTVRKDLIDTPIEVAGSRLRLTASVGIAEARDVGYDLAVLRSAAEGAARTALAEGGNRIVVAHPVDGGTRTAL